MSWLTELGEELVNGWKNGSDQMKEAWEKYVKEGGPLIKPIEVPQLSIEDVRDVIRDALNGILNQFILAYYEYLEIQAAGKWKRLPNGLIKILSPYYSDIDLNKVRYAEKIDTIHGQSLTDEYKIYFADIVDFFSPPGLYLLLHELEHVVQYKIEGGRAPFLIKYFSQGAIKIFQQHSVSIHDNIELEKAADDKAKRVGPEIVVNEYFIKLVRRRWTGWSGWAELGGWSSSLAVGQNVDGRLEIFAIDRKGILYHTWQIEPGRKKN